jgi:hypothetical protein
MGLNERRQRFRGSYGAYDSCSVADIWNIAKRFGIAGEKRVSDSKRRSRDVSTAIDDRWTNDVSFHSVLRTSFKHKSVRLAIEHILVDGSDVVFVCIVPDLTVRIGIPRSAVIDPVASAADVDQLALGTADFRFLASDDGGHEISGERVASIHCDVVFFAQGADFLEVVERADGDTIGFESGLELVFGLRAADVGSHRPIWVGLFNGSYVRCLEHHVSFALGHPGVHGDHIPPTKPEAPKTMIEGIVPYCVSQ